MTDLIEIKAAGIKRWTGIGAAVLAALILGGVAIALQFGSLLADITAPSEPNAADIASLSLRLASGDPKAHNLAAAAAADPGVSTAEAEKAVSLAPNDFRWRVTLGRAYEQTDQIEKAETQFRAAADLAPAYAYPRWHLGNFLLRNGRDDEAVEELKKATIDHVTFREQVFSLAWDYYGGDPVLVEKMASENAESRAFLSRFLAQRGQGERALQVWNQIGAADKERFRTLARFTVQDLYGKGSFAQALEMARQLGDSNAVPEAVSNASFEEPIVSGDQARFGWEILPGEPRVEIGTDSQMKFSGNRSLKISFRGLVRSDFANVYQTVVVRPDTAYTLRFRFRTEGLRSNGRPQLQIINTKDNAVLGMSEMFPPDSTDWSQQSISFRTGPNTNAISIRTFRQACGEQCSVTGILWYDDFELVKG